MESKNFLKHKKFFAARRVDIGNPALLYLVSQGLLALTPIQLSIFNDMIEGLSLHDIRTKHDLSVAKLRNIREYIRRKIPVRIAHLRQVIRIARPVSPYITNQEREK